MFSAYKEALYAVLVPKAFVLLLLWNICLPPFIFPLKTKLLIVFC
ncbi:hypothetical protein B4119_3307 [Parageobacillus caldoxylosilyticus]|uniref:Uncharacterized protein n=1 Tax=Saccharococcus caldoxylosilyticus TaxID=81408 RepID=A0A150LIG4_9BACL|nr:hypothetical protein B4119_3307 [Parageobacillus caldoxylosilyticus]